MSATNKITKVIGLIRVSSLKQEKSGLSLRAQREDILRFAAQNNLEVLEIRQEVCSGGSFIRPVLFKAFEDARKIKNCSVITSKLDRLSRRTSFISTLTDNDTPIIVAECGMYVPIFELQLRAVIAEEEKRKIGQRTKRACSVKRDKGEPMGWHLPQLADKAGSIRAMGTEAVKDEADRFALLMKPMIERMKNSKMTLSAIADELNSHNIRTQRGGKWWPATVGNIISRWN